MTIRRDAAGSVTAEAAIVLPLMAAVALALVWMLSLAIAQVRTVDAARDAARGLARGEERAAVAAAVRRTMPDGTTVSISEGGDVVRVRVAVRSRPPDWLLVPLPAVTVGSTSVVEVEPGAESVG